jgi:hypothetical protein
MIQTILNHLRQSVTKPLGLPTLDQLIFEGDKIVFIPDEQHIGDIALLLELVNVFIKNGAKAEQLTILLTDADEKIVSAVLLPKLPDGVKLFFHQPGRRDMLARLGVNDADKPIMLCRELIDADLILTMSRYHRKSPKNYFGIHSVVFPRFSDYETQQRFVRQSQRKKMADEVNTVAKNLGVIFTVQILYDKNVPIQIFAGLPQLVEESLETSQP